MGGLNFGVNTDAALVTGRKVSADKVANWLISGEWLHQAILGEAAPNDTSTPAASLVRAHNHEISSANGELDNLGAQLVHVQNLFRGFIPETTIAGTSPVASVAVQMAIPDLICATKPAHYNFSLTDSIPIRIGTPGTRYLRARVSAQRTVGAGDCKLVLWASLNPSHVNAKNYSQLVTVGGYYDFEIDLDDIFHRELYGSASVPIWIGWRARVDFGSSMLVSDEDEAVFSIALCSR